MRSDTASAAALFHAMTRMWKAFRGSATTMNAVSIQRGGSPVE
jgi:hypothetical protein